jgi:hypothetical protein
MIEQFLRRVNNFRNEARLILARHETSPERIITLSTSYVKLDALSLKQDELFRQSLRCIENSLFRAAHVLSWAGFMDFYEEKIASKKFKKLHAAYPAWSKYKTLDELRENIAEYQLIECGKKVGLLSKNEMKALHGLLNKRNECAHPSNYFPDLNDTLGYVSELIKRIEHLQARKL